MPLEDPEPFDDQRRRIVARARWRLSARALLAWALACWAGAGLGAAAGATVRVQVVDDAGGRAVAARVYLWRGDEPLLPPGFSSYSRGDERHFLVPGDFELDLEPGGYRLKVERGLEYVPVELDLVVPRDAVVPVRLRRWVDMNGDGLVLGGHARPPRSRGHPARSCGPRT